MPTSNQTTIGNNAACRDQNYLLQNIVSTDNLTCNFDFNLETSVAVPTIGYIANANANYYFPPNPKNGDIEIDGATLQAKIFDSELNKWIKCDIETIKNKDGEITLEVTYNLSVQEEKTKRNQRQVLFEKTQKPILIFGTTGHINPDNIWNDFTIQHQQPIIYTAGSNDNYLYDNIGTTLIGEGYNNNTIALNANTYTTALQTPTITLTVTNTATNMPIGTIWNNGDNIVVQTNSGPKNIMNLA